MLPPTYLDSHWNPVTFVSVSILRHLVFRNGDRKSLRGKFEETGEVGPSSYIRGYVEDPEGWREETDHELRYRIKRRDQKTPGA